MGLQGYFLGDKPFFGCSKHSHTFLEPVDLYANKMVINAKSSSFLSKVSSAVQREGRWEKELSVIHLFVVCGGLSKGNYRLHRDQTGKIITLKGIHVIPSTLPLYELQTLPRREQPKDISKKTVVLQGGGVQQVELSTLGLEIPRDSGVKPSETGVCGGEGLHRL